MVDFTEFALAWVIPSESESHEICKDTKVCECHEFWQFSQWGQRILGNQCELHEFCVILGKDRQIEWMCAIRCKF